MAFRSLKTAKNFRENLENSCNHVKSVLAVRPFLKQPLFRIKLGRVFIWGGVCRGGSRGGLEEVATPPLSSIYLLFVPLFIKIIE
jgi:hypothetical protein